MLHPEYCWVDYARGSVAARNNVVRLSEALQQRDARGGAWNSFITVFRFPDAYRQLCETTGSVGNYAGPAFADYLVFDVDRDGDLAAALADARSIAMALQNIGLREDQVRYFFSGAKGYHLIVPMALFGHVEPSVLLPRACRLMAMHVAQLAGAHIDRAIYDVNRLFRLPETQHPKTRLWKTELTWHQFSTEIADKHKDRARERTGSPWSVHDLEPIDGLVQLYAAALQKASEQIATGNGTVSSDKGRAFAEALSTGYHAGNRHRIVLAFAGWAAKKSVPRELALSVVQAVAAGDEEIEDRIRAVNDTYDTVGQGGDVLGWKDLEVMLAPDDLNTLEMAVPRPARVRVQGGTEERFSDLGNARRFVRLHGEDVRYCYPQGVWYTWVGTHWSEDVSGEIDRRAKHTIETLRREAEEEQDKATRKALNAWTLRSESDRAIRAISVLARSETGISIQPKQFDADAWLLNVQNGTLNLHTAELRAHDRGDYMSRVAPVDWDQYARAPLWERFVEEILPDDEVRLFVQRLLGYALTGVIEEHIMPVFWGAGANGKGTLLGTVQDVMGPYALEADPEILLAKGAEAHPTGLTDLEGRRLVLTSETGDRRAFAEAVMKRLTGGDRIRARRMRQDFYEFAPTHKLILVTNHKPQARSTDHGTWRRLRLIPFTVQIPADRINKKLRILLRAEWPGILAWLLFGTIQWQAQGLSEPAAVVSATDQYRLEEDVVGAFLEERTERLDPKSEELSEWWTSEPFSGLAGISAADLYQEFLKWAERNGERKMSQTAFGRSLTERGIPKQRGGKRGNFIYPSLTLKPSTE